ncbi:ester cyclase [Spirosoma sp.]|uniref:ester cyclase n=1 Tax=Spirosoma sp. TaxID=1899569 RepID=UPI003B39FA8D
MDVNQARQFIVDFIEVIWNQQQFDQLNTYLHPNYIDHSLPTALPADRFGLVQWIQATSRSFSHRTIIEDQVTEINKTILKVNMEMIHVGEWRGIEATGAQVSTGGYRCYRLMDEKIIGHWAMIDGTGLEDSLRQQAPVGCKIPVRQ